MIKKGSPGKFVVNIPGDYLVQLNVRYCCGFLKIELTTPSSQTICTYFHDDLSTSCTRFDDDLSTSCTHFDDYLSTSCTRFDDDLQCCIKLLLNTTIFLKNNASPLWPRPQITIVVENPDHENKHFLAIYLNDQATLACHQGGFRCPHTNHERLTKYKICNIIGEFKVTYWFFRLLSFNASIVLNVVSLDWFCVLVCFPYLRSPRLSGGPNSDFSGNCNFRYLK
jgi:hypothetical protein